MYRICCSTRTEFYMIIFIAGLIPGYLPNPEERIGYNIASERTQVSRIIAKQMVARLE